MKVLRLVSTSDGGSRFEDLELSDDPGGPWPEMPYDTRNLIVHFSSPRVRVQFYREGFFSDWHPTPRSRQFGVLLSGKIETMTTDGEKRVRQAGTVLLSDDLTGRGHTTRVVEGPAYSLIMELPSNYEFKRK